MLARTPRSGARRRRMTPSELAELLEGGELRALIGRGQELGFLSIEEVAETLDGLGLDSRAAEQLSQQLEEAGIELAGAR